jgi:hypothetical protein
VADAERRLAWLEERLREAGVTVMADGSVRVAPRVEPLQLTEAVVQESLADTEAHLHSEGSRSLWCALGFHKIDACSGVGPCLRGCGYVRKAVTMPGGGWRKHTVPPRPAQRPRGLPPVDGPGTSSCC